VQIIEKRKKQFFLFVTHDIEEVLHLAARGLVMSNRAATIQEVVSVDLSRRRDLDSPGYLRKRDRSFRLSER
jgi:ABC-type nitrate/sulfonate/bicarbonate transport system ATPase subunit